MGYIQLPGGIPDFSEAVISFWFRVPQASMDIAKAQYDANTGRNVNMKGVLPLVSFGMNPTISFFKTVSDGIDTTIVADGSSKTTPCVVGVLCDDDGLRLYVRIQYSNGGSSTPSDPASDILISGPDFFQVGGVMQGSVITSGPTQVNKFITVTPDQWHHVLISFDMSEGSSATITGDSVSFGSLCGFWLAYDDVNYNGQYLCPNSPRCFGPGFTGDANGIASNYSMYAKVGSFAAGPIPTSGSPIGIPTDSNNSEFVYPVGMAELQIFAGISLDTSVETNRRAFVTSSGAAANPADAQALLGQAPDILLHSTANWKAGTNTGSFDGNFTDTGTITASTVPTALG
jgi:hypothetical protein